MTSRHHYSIPGASLLKPKSSSKQPQPQKLSSNNVPGPSRDSRQPSTSRAYHSQETVYRTAPPSRPPSVNGYRSQPSPAYAGVLPTQGSSRPPPVQRPPSATPQPQASSSKSRLEVPDPRNYFSKMFSRRQSPSIPQAEDKQKSSHKHRRSSNAQVPPPMYSAPGAVQNPPPVAATSNWAAYEASLRAREAEREERARQKVREERARGKEDRMRSEYTAHMAKLEVEQAQAAAAAKANRAERSASRPDRRTQEYESDTARRRQQAQPVASSTGYRQEARLSSAQYLHPTYHYPSTNATRTVTPARDSQQPPTPSPTSQIPGVPIQHSASSQSTSASNQVHASHPSSVPAQAAPSASTVNLVPNHTQSQDQTQTHPRRTTTPPPAPKVLSMYLPPGADDRARLQREAAEREPYTSREHEREREKDVEYEKEKEREQETERAREKEERRARRAEREKRKELEREREKQKDLERTEREKLERREKERLKALERVERERQKEVERIERERLQERERDRERQHKSSSKHRSYRDKTQSSPMYPTPGAISGSDTERLNRKDRHRSQSYPSAVVSEMQPLVAPPDMHRPDHRRDQAPAAAPTPISAPVPAPVPAPVTSYSQDQVVYAQFQESSPALPVPPPLTERHDQVLYPRSTSAAAITGLQPPPQNFPGRPRTEINSSNDVLVGSGQSSMTQWSEPLPQAMQSKLVSIYASQGPPDRTPSYSTQKLELNMPVGEQVAPGLMSSYPSGGGHIRSSAQDQISHRPLAAAPSPAPTLIPTLAPGPRSGVSTIHQAPSATALRQYMTTEQFQQPTHSTTLTTATPSSDSHPRFDTYNLPPHENILPSGTSTVPPSSATEPQQVASISSQRLGYERRSSVIPAAAAQIDGPNITGSINLSQETVGPTGTQEPLRVPEQVQPSGPMSRAPSHNSTRSPAHRDTLQLPAVSSNGTSPTIPASRSVSGASKSIELGNQFYLQPTPTHQVISHSQHQAPPNTPVTPMYSSALNSSSASRASHEPSANSHRQSVFLMHSHSLSLPSNYLQNTIENASSRPDNSSNVPAATHMPASAADSVPQQRYPYNQQSVNQQFINQQAVHPQSYIQQPYNQQPFLPSNLPHNSSNNLQVSAQSQPQLQSESLQSSSGHANSMSRTPISHTHTSHPAVAVSHLSSQKPSTTLSSQSVNPPTALYHNHSSSHFHDVSYQTQQRLQTQSTAARPSLQQQNSNQAPYSSVRPPGVSTTYVTSTHQSGPFIDDTPSSLGAGLSLNSPSPVIRSQAQQPLPPSGHSSAQVVHARPPSVIAPTSTPMRSASQTHRMSQNVVRPQDNDVPPPLTPSNSSRESHEEILMTPSSLDATRAQHQQASVSLERSESQRSGKKKGGLFGLFRSSSRAKEARDQGDASRNQMRRQPPGVSQGNESMSSLRSSKQQPSMAEAVAKPAKVDPVPVVHHVRQTKTPKPVPPPIAIPSHSIPYRLFSSKSRRYRTMSSASVEALDGTANNTVVGSPTSSKRSTTPSGPGPLTPPLRDPIRAAQEWRNNEERVFVGRGRHRRRRPGVTFDLTDDDVPKNSSHYRLTRSSHSSGQKGDSSE